MARKKGGLGSGWHEVGRGEWDSGTSEGHGFRSGLFSLMPLQGSRRGAVEDAGGPRGSSGSLDRGRPSSPQSPWALPGMGGRRGTERGVAGKAERAVLGENKTPPRTAPPAGGRTMEVAAVR